MIKIIIFEKKNIEKRKFKNNILSKRNAQIFKKKKRIINQHLC